MGGNLHREPDRSVPRGNARWCGVAVEEKVRVSLRGPGMCQEWGNGYDTPGRQHGHATIPYEALHCVPVIVTTEVFMGAEIAHGSGCWMSVCFLRGLLK